MLRILLRCQCSHCAHKIDFPSGQVGTTVKCPKCGTETKLFQADAESAEAAPVKTEPLAVVPRLSPTRDFARDIGLRAENHPRPVRRALPERQGLSAVLKATCSLIGIAVIAAAILFSDQIKAFVQASIPQ
jgi:hypothetical protein